MAENEQPKPETPRRTRSQVGFINVVEKHKTIRLLVICVTIVIALAIIAETVVRIYTHSFWLELLAIMFGPSGIAVTWLSIYLWRVKRRVNQATAVIDNPSSNGQSSK
jgi:hypothetical protein